MSRTQRSDQRPISQKFWEDRSGNFVVWQKPNVWLWTWFITMVAGWILPLGFVQKATGWISLIALIIWAVFEVKNGVNYFRRSLGLLVLLLLIVVRL